VTKDDTNPDEPKPEPGREAEESPEHLTFWQMLHSVLAAAFGVQSSRNRERDFTRGRPLHFILLGIAFTALFVLAVVLVVNLVLSSV
jgi:hypothetical protein